MGIANYTVDIQLKTNVQFFLYTFIYLKLKNYNKMCVCVNICIYR